MNEVIKIPISTTSDSQFTILIQGTKCPMEITQVKLNNDYRAK